MQEMEKNYAKITFDACSRNEGFARMVVMGFMMDMDPTMDELQDVKTAVSEAVTNAIIHGYEPNNEVDEDREKKEGLLPQVEMTCIRELKKLTVVVEDHGVGIRDIEKARQPFFTTKPDEERSGMGFAFMETFMDEVEIVSEVGMGTRITMSKYIQAVREDSEQ